MGSKFWVSAVTGLPKDAYENGVRLAVHSTEEGAYADLHEFLVDGDEIATDAKRSENLGRLIRAVTEAMRTHDHEWKVEEFDSDFLT